MKKIVFQKLTVNEKKNVLAGDGDYLTLDSPKLESCQAGIPSGSCRPDTPGASCSVPTPNPEICRN